MSKIFTKLVLLLAVVCFTTSSADAAPNGVKASKISSNSVGRSPAANSNVFRSNSGNSLSRMPVPQAAALSKPATQAQVLRRPITSNSLNNATTISKVPGTISRPNLGNSNGGLQKLGKLGTLSLPGSKLPLGKNPNQIDLTDLKPLKDPSKFPGLKPIQSPIKLPGLQLPSGIGSKPFPKPPISIPTPPICGPIFPPSHCPPGPWGGCGNWGLGCNLPWFNCGYYYPTPCYTPCVTPWVNYCPTLTTITLDVPVSLETPVAATPVAEAAPASADLLVEQVVMIEAGDVAKNQGPLMRVVVLNKGTADAGKFSLGLYASLKNEPNAEMVPAGKELTQLAAGARETIEVRLPVQALAMTEQGQNERQSFKFLFAVADVQNEVTETEKRNNLLPITAADLLANAAR
jgi:hypothetical protein